MVKIVVEIFGEDALQKLFLDLSHKDDWDEECEVCRMPTLLHRDNEGRQMLGSCAGRRTELSDAAQNKADAELMNSWSLFRKKMNPIRKWYRDDMEKRQTNSDILAGLQSMTDAIVNGNKERPNKLVKPAKVPSWCKGMKYQAYKKSIEVWEENNKDMPEAARYQDVIESLKLNKDIEGLARYIGEHVVGKLDTIETQTVKDLLKLLDIKYGRTRLEDLEKLMEDWIKFNFNEHESEEEYFLYKRN